MATDPTLVRADNRKDKRRVKWVWEREHNARIGFIFYINQTLWWCYKHWSISNLYKKVAHYIKCKLRIFQKSLSKFHNYSPRTKVTFVWSWKISKNQRMPIVKIAQNSRRDRWLPFKILGAFLSLIYVFYPFCNVWALGANDCVTPSVRK